jgi:hypothetical protein
MLFLSSRPRHLFASENRYYVNLPGCFLGSSNPGLLHGGHRYVKFCTPALFSRLAPAARPELVLIIGAAIRYGRGGRARICSKRDTYPDGRDFVGFGIRPQVPVERTPASLIGKEDPALNKGVEVLKE